MRISLLIASCPAGAMSEKPPEPPQLFENRWAKESAANTVRRPMCHCLDPQYGKRKWAELRLHTDVQDEQCAGWQRLLELIEQAAADGREEFSPLREMSPQEWTQIVTLPPSIARLKAVKHLILYGSSLVRIPPEIGEMTSLQQFTPYTSYRLHWFPYEITRCRNLARSTVSTRALYGNYKYRAPFPRLPQIDPLNTPDRCSLCEASLLNVAPQQVWISLPVATDVIPLLVHACSAECLARLPAAPPNYVRTAHRGGLDLVQPRRSY